MLVLIIGRIGSGKTLFLIFLATKLKRFIYANFLINLPHFKPFILSKLKEIPKNVNVFLDEGYILSEARRSSSAMNLIMSYVYNQSRKTLRDIFLTSQLASAIDKRFRLQATLLIECEKINGHFFYTITNRTTGMSKIMTLSESEAQKLYPLYDTYEVVVPLNDIDSDFELAKKDANTLILKAREYGNMIDNELLEFTHEGVRQALFFLGLSMKFEPYVYLYLKKKRKAKLVREVVKIESNK